MNVTRRGLLVGLLLTGLSGCHTPEPLKEIALGELEAYWAIDSKVAGTNYIAPAVRFTLKNLTDHQMRSVQVQAVFRRKGDDTPWASDWRLVTPPGKPLPAGQIVLLNLKSEARYYSTGNPESFFQHQLFKDTNVNVFVRVGSSSWVKFGTLDVERRIGTRALDDGTPRPSPTTSASAPPAAAASQPPR